jgi:hypothetical protein
MPGLLILLAAMGFTVAIIVFANTAPAGPSFWYGHPWWDLFGAWVMLLTSAVLFVVLAIFVMRRVSQTLWFFSLVACSFPVLAALLPVAHYMHVVKHSDEYVDAGADVPFLISCADRVYVLSLAFSGILACMVTYGYFARRKT